MIEKNGISSVGGWAAIEFGNSELGDKRRTSRLICMAERFSESPESPINLASLNWAETKAAYRFFQNENIEYQSIIKSHTEQTIIRSQSAKIVLGIQDTSYFSWKHPKTKGLGKISNASKAPNSKESKGVLMHTCFAVSTEGLPLGILNQKIFAREPVSEELKKLKEKNHNNNIPIQDKESFRWLETLNGVHDKTKNSKIKVVTVCDREGDFYEFLESANSLGESFLVRSRGDRLINKESRYSKEDHIRLWTLIPGLPIQGVFEVEVPAKDEFPKRKAILDVRFGSFTMNPPRSNLGNLEKKYQDLNLNAIYIKEQNPPENQECLEWMLLTNLEIKNLEDAVEKVRWYCLRWRIEIFHKILKSGLRVEDCRLGTADRLIRFLSIMSVIAWRIFWLTLTSRTNPDLDCTTILTNNEWQVLFIKLHKTKKLPTKAPNIKQVTIWIAQLGGFLARKGDGDPGPMHLWRGWKRLCDLSEGWAFAQE